MLNKRDHALYAAGKHAGLAEDAYRILAQADQQGVLDHAYMRTVEIAVTELHTAIIEATDAGCPDLANHLRDTYTVALADLHRVVLNSDRERIANDPLADTHKIFG